MANSSIKNLNIDGNVIISGSTTSIDVQQLTTDDPNITLNNVDSPTDSNANGGGITVKGSTDKIFNWINATDSWTSSEHLDLAVGKEYFIDGTSVLSATSLGSGITSIPGTLTSLQVDNIYIDGSQIGLAVTDTDLIALAENAVSVSGDITATGSVAAAGLFGDGSGITGISTSNISVPASPGDFLYNDAGNWGGITPPISIALGGTGATTEADARTNLGLGTAATFDSTDFADDEISNVDPATGRTNLGLGTAATYDATYFADDLLSNVAPSTGRTNLGLGTTDSPQFGGEGNASVTISATPSSSGTVAPTFAGTVFKNIPVTAGSGHKWVMGIEQDGDLPFSYFTIDDTGANTSTATSYITLSLTNNLVVLGNTADGIGVAINSIEYPTADGTPNQVITTDGSGTLSFATPSTSNITEGTNLYYTDTRFDTRLATKSTDDLTEGTNLYYTTTRANADFDTRLATKTTDDLTEGTNLYYTDARVSSFLNGNLDGHIIPDTNEAYDLGSSLFKFRDLYLSGTSIKLGGATITATGSTVVLPSGSGIDGAGDLLDTVTHTTDDLAEGVTNLYFTNSRADARITAASLYSLANVETTSNPTDGQTLSWNNSTLRWEPGNAGHASTTTLAEGTNLYYTDTRFDTRLATKTTDDLAEGANLYYTTTRANTDFDTRLATKTTDDLAEGANLYYTDTRADARITNAGVTPTTVSNWNTAYTDTNAAVSINTADTLVKRDGSGNFIAGQIEAEDGVLLGNTTTATAGLVRWTGTDFQGYNGATWVSLTSAAVAQISGSVATFTTSPTVTSTSYSDIAGYTTAITVTSSNIINVQVNVSFDDPTFTGVNSVGVKLVRVIGGTSTDLYEQDEVFFPGMDFNVSHADVHGQTNGTVITYKLQAKVDAGTLTVNPDATNAQIFVQELTTSPINVASVNGATGTVILDTDDIGEGSTNLYYTDGRFDTRLATKTTDDLAEGTTNVYHQNDLGGLT